MGRVPDRRIIHAEVVADLADDYESGVQADPQADADATLPRPLRELNEKQEEYLKDIHASGQHLLSLINDTSLISRRSRPGGWSWS